MRNSEERETYRKREQLNDIHNQTSRKFVIDQTT